MKFFKFKHFFFVFVFVFYWHRPVTHSHSTWSRFSMPVALVRLWTSREWDFRICFITHCLKAAWYATYILNSRTHHVSYILCATCEEPVMQVCDTLLGAHFLWYLTCFPKSLVRTFAFYSLWRLKIVKTLQLIVLQINILNWNLTFHL